jgi:RND family efflux transporter MFP subunit
MVRMPLPIGLLLAALLSGAAFAQSAKPAAPVPWGAQPSGVPVVRPLVQTVSDYVELTGNAAPVNSVNLIARVEGYLDAVLFADGARVRKGDKLFSIQPDQYKASLQQAQAAVQLQQAALLHAKTEVGRYTKLVKQDAATQVEVDNWVYQKAAAEAQLVSAQAQVALAQLNVNYTNITAPFDGLMGKHLVDPGNVVGGPGQPTKLAEIIQLDPIYAVANLNEQDLQRIRGRLDNRRLTLAALSKVPIEVGLANETGFPFRGHLEYASPGIDPATGTLLLRGILDNHDISLLPGMFLRMRIPMPREVAGALLIPNSSIGEDQSGRYVLVVNKDDVVERRGIQQGELLGELRVITSGVSKDDRVVTGELWRAVPGTKIVPQLTTIALPKP